MHNLTLQIFDAGKWHDAMVLSFDAPDKGFESRCSFGYETAYLVSNIEAIGSPFSKAASALYPLDWEGRRSITPAFMHDIAPAGAARRFLLARLGQEKPADIGADLYLLGRCTPAPIGNMRIKESAEVVDERKPIGFERREVISRDQTSASIGL